MGLLAVIGPSRNDQRCADRSLRRRYLVRMPWACHQARISRSMAGKSTLAETGLNVGMAIASFRRLARESEKPVPHGTGVTTRGTTHLPDPATTVCIAARGARPERDADVRFRAPGYGGDADRRAGPVPTWSVSRTLSHRQTTKLVRDWHRVPGSLVGRDRRTLPRHRRL